MILLFLMNIALGAEAQTPEFPNILFIAVDDLNDWAGYMGGYPGEVYTPHLDRLAAEGVAFYNAQTPSPLCGPSRAAILTGLRPTTSGIYYNDQWIRPNLPEIKTIPTYFRENGYYTAGAGKIFHHTAGFNPPDQWDEYFDQVFDDPWNHANYYTGFSDEKPDWFPKNNISREQYPTLAGAFDWGVWEDTSEPMGDQQAVNWAKDFLNDDREQPFFLAVGTYRPHIPWYAPPEYFDRYSLSDIKLPLVVPGDLDDVPPGGKKMAAHRRQDFEAILQENQYREAVRSYLACISYADALVGQLLDALATSPYADNTIVVLWSDHGWHLGEKQHWHKSTLWEEAARVPFIIKAPGMAPQKVFSPVNLIDIYPTLLTLSGLPSNSTNDGNDLTPVLRGEAESQPFSLTTFGPGNHSVRDERYRYLRYQSGGEEFYDLKTDPMEFNNLAQRQKYKKRISKMKSALPDEEQPPVPRKGAFDFDPETYTWDKINGK